MIRERKIKSGNMLEAEFYPIFDSGRAMPTRNKKIKPSSKEQKNLNDKNARKKIIRLINTNFKEGDTVVHGTYRDDEMPTSEEQCRRDVQNYIRRVKRFREKQKLPEMKYIYVIEAKVSKRTGVLRYHFHMIMSKMDRDMAERMWKHGDYTNADRLQEGEKGFEALAKYLVKSPEGSRRWCQSKNLLKPKIMKPRDGRISKRHLDNLCTHKAYDKEYWERLYPGYKFIESEPYFNEYNGYWYLTVTLFKKSERIIKI